MGSVAGLFEQQQLEIVLCGVVWSLLASGGMALSQMSCTPPREATRVCGASTRGGESTDPSIEPRMDPGWALWLCGGFFVIRWQRLEHRTVWHVN